MASSSTFLHSPLRAGCDTNENKRDLISSPSTAGVFPLQPETQRDEREREKKKERHTKVWNGLITMTLITVWSVCLSQSTWDHPVSAPEVCFYTPVWYYSHWAVQSPTQHKSSSAIMCLTISGYSSPVIWHKEQSITAEIQYHQRDNGNADLQCFLFTFVHMNA